MAAAFVAGSAFSTALRAVTFFTDACLIGAFLVGACAVDAAFVVDADLAAGFWAFESSARPGVPGTASGFHCGTSAPVTVANPWRMQSMRSALSDTARSSIATPMVAWPL